MTNLQLLNMLCIFLSYCKSNIMSLTMTNLQILNMYASPSAIFADV